MRKKKITGVLLVTILLTGCGNKVTMEPAPELLEPISFQLKYVSVERGDVADGSSSFRKRVKAVITAKTYPQFFLENTDVAEVLVKVNDQVKAGDTLAKIDVAATQKKRLQMEREIDYLQEMSALEEEKYQSELAMAWDEQNQEYIFETHDLLEDNVIVESVEVIVENSIPFEVKENHSYEQKKNAFEIEYLQEQLHKTNELLQKKQLVADHDGKVTYVRNLVGTENLGCEENVVVLSDESELFITLEDVKTNQKLFAGYPFVYAYVDGKKYPIEALEETEQEKMVMQSKHVYGNQRARFCGESPEVQLGDTFEVVFYKFLHEDVLRIPKEALMQDEKGDFVYVGDETKDEIRYIAIGYQNNEYVEVTEGLTEGEKVRYQRDGLKEEPGSKEAKLLYQQIDGWKKSVTEKKCQNAKIEGIVSSVLVKKGDTVKKGDIICKIKTEEGKTAVQALNNEQLDRTGEYDRTIEELDKQIKDVYADITANDLRVEAEMVPLSSYVQGREDSLDREVRTAVDRMMELDEEKAKENAFFQAKINSLNVQKKMEQLSYTYEEQELTYSLAELIKDRDGEGLILVRSDVDGVLSELKVREGMHISLGEQLFEMEVPGQEKVILTCKGNLYPGQMITFENNGKTYEGKVTSAYAENAETPFFTTRKDMVYISYNRYEKKENIYFALVEDSFWELKDLTKCKCKVPNLMLGEEK